MTKVNISEALHEINEQIIGGFVMKQLHPVGFMYFLFSGKKYVPSLTSYTKTTKENCKRIRNFINSYVLKRKSGEIKSQVKVDLLSIFLNAPDIFTDELIVDELMDFFLAGVQTLQFTAQTMISYFSKNPDGLAKVRQEFESTVGNIVKHDSSLRGQNKKELLRNIVTLETAQDQTNIGRKRRSASSFNHFVSFL